ncbi:MAG: hypothetical protein JRI76_07910 [Deltaproteobacteria bacterium]|nr:hypothetical protein [Deltaproteobacteria bacterium]MBW2041943.1 hypothetical protein [Deltaproteobacteria bacterium]MBW2133345.1 hypothetical protein [Deltaproteobacteria bacterium]
MKNRLISAPQRIKEHRMRRITTTRFDISGAEVPRVAKHALISRFAKYEDFSGGPGFRNLLFAFMAHYGGGLLVWLFSRFENRSARWMAVLRRHFSGR